MAYEIGPVYVWQNQTGNWAYLNGTECRVLGPVERFRSVLTHDIQVGQLVDTVPPGKPTWCAYVTPGDLRRRDPPPSGEQSIFDQFKVREHA